MARLLKSQDIVISAGVPCARISVLGKLAPATSLFF